jgi:hypothetical protein
MAVKHAALIVVGVFACIQLFQIKFGHGTLVPPVVMSLSTPYRPRHDVDPPPWFTKIQTRVVVSLTTIPSNADQLTDTVFSVMAQTYPIDAIYLVLPMFNARTLQNYSFYPSHLEVLGVTIVRPAVDAGPVSKLVGVLAAETDPDTIIVTLDDDKLYDVGLVRKLVWNMEMSRGVAMGTCGWVKVNVPPPELVVPGYFVWAIRNSGRYVDVLQACCGTAYRVEDIADIKAVLSSPPDACFTADDLWISAVLDAINIKRLLLGGKPKSKTGIGYDSVTPWWRTPSPFALSSINRKAGHDAACIAAAKGLLR